MKNLAFTLLVLSSLVTQMHAGWFRRDRCCCNNSSKVYCPPSDCASCPAE